MPTAVRRQRGLDALRPYTPGKPIEEVQREYGISDVVKLASNENPLGPSPKVMAALQAALPQMHLYPDAQGYALRQALARHHDVRPDQVRIGNGADGLIRELCAAFLEDGDEVVVSRSSFPVYDISSAVMRGRLVKTPLRDYRLDLTAMAQAITPAAKLVFIANPNNPTGTINTAAEVEAFMAQAADHALVVFDEAYYEFVDSADYPDTLRYVREGRPNVIVLRTFSKSHGIAGLRLGYGIANPEVLAPLMACSESFPVNRLAQIAGIAALEDREFLEQTIAANRAGREYLYRMCDRLYLFYLPSHGNFVLVHIGPAAQTVFELLLRQGIIVRTCVAYDLPEFLRISVGTAEQNERLARGLEAALRTARSGCCGRSATEPPRTHSGHGQETGPSREGCFPQRARSGDRPEQGGMFSTAGTVRRPARAGRDVFHSGHGQETGPSREVCFPQRARSGDRPEQGDRATAYPQRARSGDRPEQGGMFSTAGTVRRPARAGRDVFHSGHGQETGPSRETEPPRTHSGHGQETSPSREGCFPQRARSGDRPEQGGMFSTAGTVRRPARAG
ncbi:MAG: histidinol-phosphate transaminase, partial [Chloroflexi bacterium]|nr:histidinol-phosphate transaminase [Chloroflexota bacterium]